MKFHKGFTLIEIMIVIVIIGILVAIAMPLYQDYTKRSHIAEGLTLSSDVRYSVTEFYITKGNWPVDNAEAGLPSNIIGNSVKTIKVQNNVIIVIFDSQVTNNAELQLTGTDVAGTVSWDCVAGVGMQEKWLPPSCRL